MTECLGAKRFPYLCILASAGAGKTFRLTYRYLDLASAGAGVGSILATTFTRAAAGDIRNRIFMNLVNAARDESKLAELAKYTQCPSLQRKQVLSLLRNLTGNIHRLQIRTLDSFFGSIVRSYSTELGIPPNAKLVDEAQAEAMRQEAVRLMLDEREPQRLIDLLRRLIQGGSDRSVVAAIDDVVSRLHSLFREAPPQAWEPFDELPALTAPQLVEAIQRLEDTPPEEDNKSHTKAHSADCEQARALDWRSFISTGLAKAIATGEATYSSKPILETVMEAYRPVIDHARAVIANRLRKQTLATGELLAMFDAQYEATQLRRGMVTFDDITAAMTRARHLGRFEEICFRIDAQIQHLLLDEFQDTSIPQWRAIEPIATEIISDATRPRSFFCVGDAKQSIYGWREAAPEVLEGIPHLLTEPGGPAVIKTETLATSYRSSPEVIGAVNEVFEQLADNAAVSEYAEAVDAFSTSFEKHDTARTELPGCVQLRTFRRAGEDVDKSDLHAIAAAQLAKSLHEKNPDKKIALLTRTNRAANRLLFEFSSERLNLPASGRGGSPLTDAPAVELILDLLALADHPDNTAAAFNIAHSPLGEALAFTSGQHAARRRRLSRLIRRQLLDRGYAAMIAAWTAALAPACDERQYRRLLQLIDLAGLHDESPTLRTGDFIKRVEQRAVSAATPAPIQAMTIHQAKGLEFDAVILPELESSLTGERTPPVVVERDGPTGPVTRICRYANQKTVDLLPELKPMFDSHRTRTVRESLSLLYVAMTRARQALYMLIDPPKLSGTPKQPSTTIPKTAAGVLRCALLRSPEPPEEDTILYETGEPDWMEPGGAPAAAPPVAGDDHPGAADLNGPIRLARPSGRNPRGIAAEAASALAEARSATLGQWFFTLPHDDALDRGTAIHKLFEQIEWLEDWDRDDAGLIDLVRSTLPRRDEAWAGQQVEDFIDMLDKPQTRQLLERGEAAGSRQAHRELPFARLIDGRIQSGYIDRLTLDRDEAGSVIRAAVIDFKSDPVEPAEAAAKAEHYRPQLEVYRQAVIERFSPPPEAGIRLIILFVHHGIAVDLT